MAEYSRMASGQVISNGAGQTAVMLPFIPDFIEISNSTRAAAASGVTRAWWETDMGQGAAFVTTTSAGPADGTSFITAATGTGFSTIQAGLSLQFGPVAQHNGTIVTDFSMTAANPIVVTTVGNHLLVTGNVVIFQNLYQTSTTGMQQIAGIPFVVTVTGATTFSINWNGSGSNYTAFNTSTSTGNVGSFKQVLYPVLYAPGAAFINFLTLAATTTVTTTAPHNFKVGQEVAFRIPLQWGPYQLNSLPNVLIPGSPIYGYVVSVTNSTVFVVNINSTGYTPFNPNQTFLGFKESFPQVVAVGDVNTGGKVISAGSALYPSPDFFNGFTSSTSVGVLTINGPAIQGAYCNATFMGFLFDSGVGGTAADVVFFRAYQHDVNF